MIMVLRTGVFGPAIQGELSRLGLGDFVYYQAREKEKEEKKEEQRKRKIM